jgi:parallel beta-helix repeat protein
MGQGGRGLGQNREGGVSLRRSSPSLWNVGYYHAQFWDGRVTSLEEQAVAPIINKLELDEDPERLLAELKEIPEYIQKFDESFSPSGSTSVTLENIGKAIAAFERTLTANNSPFDRFVGGDREALSDSQRRGFNIFRSGRTRCIECHGLPTFADRDFKALGVPDSESQPDLGRFEITQKPLDKFAFKVPTLRNIALTAPYMHNGSLADLDEVIDFYSSGGEPKIGVAVDDKLRAFLLSKQEREDLIAFLFSLTDESNLPQIPDKVPSGLPVVSRIDNPIRELVARYGRAAARQGDVKGPAQVLRVESGQSIQKAIDRSRPGDVIEVMPGTYNEPLVVDVDNLVIRGITARAAAGSTKEPPGSFGGEKRPVLDGKKEIFDGLIVSAKDVRFEGFEIRDYLANAVFAQYARNLTLTDLTVQKTGLYGIHILNSNDVAIENVAATKAIDIGIYVNGSRNCRISACETYGNAVGIHVENCLGTVIETNFVHDNSCGIIVSALPNNTSTVAKDCLVIKNRIINNNAMNPGELSTFIGGLPEGRGVIIIAADNTEITANEIRGHGSYAVGVLGPRSFMASGASFDVGMVPENNWIHDNTYSDNGKNPESLVLKAGLGGGDLAWDFSGPTNRWDEEGASRATPILKGGWPGVARRAYWRILNLL